MKKRNSTLPRIDVEFCGFSHLGGLQFWQNFVLTKIKRNLFIYLFNIKISKKNLLSQIPYFWGVKKKGWVHFFHTLFSFGFLSVSLQFGAFCF